MKMDQEQKTSKYVKQIMELQEARLPSWGRLNRYRLKAILEYAGASILDIGCSSGNYVFYLNNLGHRALGIDLLIDPQWSKEEEKTCFISDAMYLPFMNEAFDTVLTFEVLEHVNSPEQAIQEIHRVCRENVILSVPDCALSNDFLGAGLIPAHWRDRSHRNFFTQEKIKVSLEENGFQLIKMTLINPLKPDFLILRSFFVPEFIARFISGLTRRIPLRKKYFMTILLVANKINKSRS